MLLLYAIKRASFEDYRGVKVNVQPKAISFEKAENATAALESSDLFIYSSRRINLEDI